MKNRKKAAFGVVGATILLAACSGRVNETVASGEMVAPEMSSEELLVSSLEYLLLDEEEKVDKEQEEEAVQDTQELATEKSEAVIYYGNGGSHELKRETVEIEEIAAEELINALAKHNIVSLDTKVLSFEEEQQNSSKILHLDLSRAAGEYIRTMSKEAECIIIASVTNTFLENYTADAICLTVEGEPLTSAHRVYKEEISKCTPEELLEILDAGESETSGSVDTKSGIKPASEADSEEIQE